MLLSELSKFDSTATPNCKPTGSQIGDGLCMRMPCTTPSTTSLVIHTLAAGANPCKTLSTAREIVSTQLVDHTNLITLGRLMKAPGICLKLKPSSSLRRPSPLLLDPLTRSCMQFLLLVMPDVQALAHCSFLPHST